MSMIYTRLTNSIRNAAFSLENWNKDGDTDWNLVELHAVQECFHMYASVERFYSDFDEIVNLTIAEIRKDAESEARFEMLTS